MATRLEDLVIRLTADNAELRRSLSVSQREIQSFSRQTSQSITSLTNVTRGLTAAFAAIGGLAVFKQAIDAAVNLGDSLSNTAERIGITAVELQRLQAAAEPAGTSADTLDRALLKLTRSIGEARVGTGSLNSALKDTRPELLAALTGAENTSEAFLRLADGIAGIEDPAERARIAQAALGRSGVELVNVLAQGRDGLEAIGDQAERVGRVLSNEAVKALDDFGDALGEVNKVALAGFAEGIATALTGSESLTTLLSDEKTLKGLSDFAQGIGAITGFVIKLAALLPDVVRDFQAIPAIGYLLSDTTPRRGSGASGSWADGDGANMTPVDAGVGMSTGAPFSSSELAAAIGRGRRSVASGGGGARIATALSDFSLGLSGLESGLLEANEQLSDEIDAEMDRLFADIDSALTDIGDRWDEETQRMSASADLFGSFASNVFRDFVDDGKVNLRELVISFGQAIVEMEIRALASSVFGGISKGVGGKGGGSIFAGLVSALGGLVGLADGGIVSRPTLAMIGEGGEPEAVIPLSKLRGSAGAVNVTVVNSGAPLEVTGTQRRRTNAGDELRVAVRNAWRGDAARGEFRDALGQRHAPGVG